MKLKVMTHKFGANDAIEGYGVVRQEGKRIARGVTYGAIS